MGVTKFSMSLLEQYLPAPGSFVVELGAQNNYAQPNLPAPYMVDWYKDKHLNYWCIDTDPAEVNKNYYHLLAHDLSKPLPQGLNSYADLVTDFGTSEHVGTTIEDYYQCWLNKYNLCKPGGLIISENPHTGSWYAHGRHYISLNFYQRLATFLRVIDYGTHAAMNNKIDGWNVWAVAHKLENGPAFPDFETFKSFGIWSS